MTGDDGGPEPPRVLDDAGLPLDGGPLHGEDGGPQEDAGHVAEDAGPEDAGPDGGAVDSGTPADAGHLDDAGVLDAGVLADGGSVEPGDAGSDGGPLSCGTLQALRDDFDDNAPAAQWAFSFQQGPVMKEIDESLQFELGSENGYSGYLSQHAGSLRDSSVTVRLLETFPSTTSGVTFLALILDDNNQLLIGDDGVGFFASVINEGQQDRYDYAHADGAPPPTWARIRHDSDTILFELSVDGAAWDVVHQRTPPFPIDSLLLEIAAGQSPTSESGTARWDDLNVQAPKTLWCPAEGFDLDLGGEVLGASLVSPDACTLTDDEPSGELRFSDDDGDVACRVSSRDAFSLEDSFVAVHVKDRNLASNVFGGIAVADESFDYIDLGFTGSDIYFSAPVNSGRAITTFAAGAYTWLALSADSQGRVAASASPDGVTWTRLHTLETVMPLDVVHVQMGLKEHAGESMDPSQLTLSDFNAPTTPPPAPLAVP